MLLLSLDRKRWSGGVNHRLPLLLTADTPPHGLRNRSPLLFERHGLEVEHLVERDHVDGALGPPAGGGRRLRVGGGEAPHVAGREGVGELALHLLGGDGVEAAEHGVLDVAGHLGAAAGVPGAAGQVLLEAVEWRR